MEALKNKVLIVFDRGMFSHLAERLAREFGKVMYYSHWKTMFSKSSADAIGKGIKGVERVSDFYDHLDEADIVVFPDIGDGDLQEHLKKLGKRVWGSGRADDLEINRWDFRMLQSKLGMAHPEADKLTGIGQLREFLKKNTDRYIKIDRYRGDMETWHHDNYELSEPYLEDLETRLGAKKDDVVFVAERPIGMVEVGFDGWAIDGQFPEVSMYGYEIKDQAYLGKITGYDLIPEALRKINEEVAPKFKELGLRGFFSSEVRVDKNRTPYFIDPCLRMGSPPGEVMVEAYENLGEIIWEGADGNLVKPKPLGAYSGMALMYSEFGDSNWMNIEIPKEIERWVKIKHKMVNKRGTFGVPMKLGHDILGAVVAIGDTPEEVIDLIEERAKMVKAFDVEIKTDFLKQAMDTVNEGKKYGIDF